MIQKLCIKRAQKDTDARWAYKNGKPLTELQKLGNKIKSRVRARIELLVS